MLLNRNNARRRNSYLVCWRRWRRWRSSGWSTLLPLLCPFFFFFVLVILRTVGSCASGIWSISCAPSSFLFLCVCWEKDEDDDIWSSCSAFPCFLGFFSGFYSSSSCSRSPASFAFSSSSVSSVVKGEGGAPWVTCFLLYGLLWLTREWRRAPLFLLKETGAHILLFPGSVFFFFSSSALFSPPVPPVFLFLPPPSRGCLYSGFYRAGRSIGAVTAGSNGVGCSIQWRNVPAFNGGAAAEEENERTVACPKTTPFSNFKGCFQFGSWNSCNFSIKPLVKM